GEHLPCPSAPQAESATKYTTSNLVGSNQDGAKVYSCNPPERLLSVEGGSVTELEEGAMIVCNQAQIRFF
ncbi:hypothetical protein PENTCL1PPCAC_25568, partial [Pristionchus entomophagus]